MANEIDIQLQNSSAFGQLQQGFAGIERNMASIVVTLDKIVKASKQAEESQKKAAEGPIDSIKKARDAVRSYQKQVEEAGKGTPQLASALMKLADARAELTRQERAAAMTMNTNRGMLTEYKAVGSAVSAVNDNLKEMYQTMRSSGSSTGMTNVAASVEKVNQALEKTVQLQQRSKQTHEQMVLAAMKAANARVQHGDMVQVADVRKQIASKLSSAEIEAAIDKLIEKRIVAAHRYDRQEMISDSERAQLYPSDGNFHNTLSMWVDAKEDVARLNALIDEAVAAGHEMEAVSQQTSEEIKVQVSERKQALNIAKQELTVQQQIVKAIHDQQVGFNSGKGKGNMSIAGLRGQLPGVASGDFDEAFRQLVVDEVINPKKAAKKNIGTAGNFVFGSGEYSQVSIAEREKFDAMMRSMQAQEVASAPADSRMSTRQLYEATRENRNARRSMQMEFYNQSQGAAGGGYLYHTLMKEAESDRKAEMDALRNQIQQRYAYGPLRTQQDANVEQSIRREAESDRQQEMSALRNQIEQRYAYEPNRIDQNARLSQMLSREAESTREQEMSALRNQIEQRYAYEPNKIQQNAAVGQMLSREAEDARAQEMLALRNQIQQRYVYEPDRIQQNASIGHMMNRDVESERAQQMNRLKNDIIERYSQPVESSPEFFDKRRRDLMQERSRIPAGDTAAIKKNVEDLRNLELQANRANQTYKTLNATMASQAQAGTASEYEEKISALKTLQNTVAGNTSEYKRLGAQIKQTENEFSAFKGDIIAVAGSTDKLESEVKELQASINKLEPNTPEWKRMNDELFTTKRRLQEVNDQTKQYQKMQGKGWFGRTFMTPIGNGGGNGGAGGGLAGFGGTAMGQVKTLAATYLGLYEGINAVVRELEHGKEALRHQFEKGIIGQQEVVKQAATLGNDMLGPMKKWAQENQGELMTSQENILNLAGFTKQMGVTDIDGIKEMTAASLKVAVGDVEVARGLQQLAVILMKTQGSSNFMGALGQARQMAEASAGVNELIFNQNIADRMVTMSIASQMQKVKPLTIEQIGEFMGAGSRTFSDTSGDTISRAILVGFDQLIDFKPRKSYKGTRVPDETMDAYKNATTLMERFDIVSQSKELGFQFAKEKASRQGPLAESVEKMFTSSLFRENLKESQQLITSLDDAAIYIKDQQRVVEDNTKVLGIVNKSLMAMNEAITTDKATAAGSSQGIMDRVAKIDLAGWDAKDRGVAAIVEHNAQVKMLADGGGYNEAMLKLMNVQSLIKSQQEKGVQEENPIMQQLRAAEDGLAALADQMNDMMTPAEKELKRISSILESMKDRPAGHVLQGRKAQDEFKMLLEGQRKLSTPEGRGEFNRKHEEKKKLQRDIQDRFKAAVEGAAGGVRGAVAGEKAVLQGGGLFSVPPEQLLKGFQRTERLRKMGINDSIIQSAKAADNQVSGQSNSGKDRFRGDTVSGTAGSRIIREMMGTPQERNLVEAIVPMVGAIEKAMMGEPPDKHEFPKPYSGSRFPGDDTSKWPKGKKSRTRPVEDEIKKAATEDSVGDEVKKATEKTDFAENVRKAAAELKRYNEEVGGPRYLPSTRPIENGALRAHMATGKVGAELFGPNGNGSSLDANLLAGQIRGRMSEIEPQLLGDVMRQANSYNGFTAAMNDPNRLTPDEKLRIAKESAKRYMEGGDAGDPTGLGERFKKGSPIAVDSPFVSTGKTWWEREQAAQSAGNVRLDMTMPEGSAHAVRAATAKMEEKRRLKETGERPAEVPLTKKQLATPEGRAEQKARDLRDARKAGVKEAAPVETDPVVLRARKRMEDKKIEREERIKELNEKRKLGNEQSSVDPEMKDILKALAMALNAFEAKSKSQPEVRIARIPTPRQPAAASVS